MACLVDGHEKLMKFKIHLLEAVEELKLRRRTEQENENRITQLVDAKLALEKLCGDAMNRAHVAEEDLVTKTAELNRKHAADKKELLDQHARQAICIEAAENEAKLLKDDVHMLQVSNYSLEGQVRELERKLQFQTNSFSTGSKQLSEMETMYTLLCKDVNHLADYLNKLDVDVKEVTKFNTNLNAICRHQKQCLMVDQAARIAQLESELSASETSLLRSRSDLETALAKHSVELQSLQIEFNVNQEEVRRGRLQLQVNEEKLMQTLQLLSESQQLSGRHLDASKAYCEKSNQLTNEITAANACISALQNQLDELVKKCSKLEELNVERDSKHKIEVDEYERRLQKLEDKYRTLAGEHQDLKHLNSQWAEKNMGLVEQNKQLQAALNKDVISVGVETKCSSCDQIVQTSVNQFEQATMTQPTGVRDHCVQAVSESVDFQQQTDVPVVVDESEVQSPVILSAMTAELNVQLSVPDLSVVVDGNCAEESDVMVCEHAQAGSRSITDEKQKSGSWVRILTNAGESKSDVTSDNVSPDQFVLMHSQSVAHSASAGFSCLNGENDSCDGTESVALSSESVQNPAIQIISNPLNADAPVSSGRKSCSYSQQPEDISAKNWSNRQSRNCQSNAIESLVSSSALRESHERAVTAPVEMLKNMTSSSIIKDTNYALSIAPVNLNGSCPAAVETVAGEQFSSAVDSCNIMPLPVADDVFAVSKTTDTNTYVYFQSQLLNAERLSAKPPAGLLASGSFNVVGLETLAPKIGIIVSVDETRATKRQNLECGGPPSMQQLQSVAGDHAVSEPSVSTSTTTVHHQSMLPSIGNTITSISLNLAPTSCRRDRFDEYQFSTGSRAAEHAGAAVAMDTDSSVTRKASLSNVAVTGKLSHSLCIHDKPHIQASLSKSLELVYKLPFDIEDIISGCDSERQHDRSLSNSDVEYRPLTAAGDVDCSRASVPSAASTHSRSNSALTGWDTPSKATVVDSSNCCNPFRTATPYVLPSYSFTDSVFSTEEHVAKGFHASLGSSRTDIAIFDNFNRSDLTEAAKFTSYGVSNSSNSVMRPIQLHDVKSASHSLADEHCIDGTRENVSREDHDIHSYPGLTESANTSNTKSRFKRRLFRCRSVLMDNDHPSDCDKPNHTVSSSASSVLWQKVDPTSADIGLPLTKKAKKTAVKRPPLQLVANFLPTQSE